MYEKRNYRETSCAFKGNVRRSFNITYFVEVSDGWWWYRVARDDDDARIRINSEGKLAPPTNYNIPGIPKRVQETFVRKERRKNNTQSVL